MHPKSEKLHAIFDELKELHDKKQADYGRSFDPFYNIRCAEDWGIPSWVGAMMRLNDKVRRLQKLAVDGKLSNESAQDSFKDIAVYAIIALIEYEQSINEKDIQGT